jgi:hypothetical protein
MTQHTIVAAFTALALVLAAPGPAAAECPADGATPFTAGPAHPANGFAEYLRDDNGLALELCLDGDGTGTCFFDPPVDGNLFSQQIGFGPEAFWWLAEASLSGTGFSGLVVMAAEAAFALENPAPGEQFAFTRLRIRLDVPAAGTYTVTHPYGEIAYAVAAVGAGDEVDETIDLPFAPDTAGNIGRVGPWLTQLSPVPPTGYVGDGTGGTVTGSPCGTNFFRVSGVALDGSPNLLAETDQFVVHGKRWDGGLATPLVADRTTYERDASGNAQVDLFATSAGTQVVASGLPAGSVLLETDVATRFFRSVLLGATDPPSFVALVATGGATTDPTRLLGSVVDVVRITRAEYDLLTGRLVVQAVSSDAASPPALRVLEFDTPVGVEIETLAPPATVTVVSSRGGRDVEPVSIVSGAAANQPPVAVADVATTAEDTPVEVAVLGNDSDPDGDPLTVVAVANAVNGTVSNLGGGLVRFTPAANFDGTASFGYTVSDGTASATATVTVTVTPVNDAPVAANDTAATPSGSSVEIAPLGNDTDVDGPTPLAIAALTQPASGTGTVQLNGDRVVYTAPAGFAGTAQFTYRAQDGAGAQSGVATVTVTVSAVPVVDLDVTRFSASGRVRLARNESVAFSLRVRNGGTVEGSADATLVGTRNGVEVYRDVVRVSDAIGRGDTTFSFRTYTPTTTGAINWTVVIDDVNGDVDRATATTNVQ